MFINTALAALGLALLLLLIAQVMNRLMSRLICTRARANLALRRFLLAWTVLRWSMRSGFQGVWDFFLLSDVIAAGKRTWRQHAAPRSCCWRCWRCCQANFVIYCCIPLLVQRTALPKRCV